MHFIDENVYRDPRFPGWVIVGSMGWYVNLNPQTKDARFMPVGLSGSNCHHHLLREQDMNIGIKLGEIGKDEKMIFMSHFPVIPVPGNEGYKGDWPDDDPEQFDGWNWSRRLGEILQEDYDCRYFLCGHSHSYHNGPLRYECGSGAYEVSDGRGADLTHLRVQIA